MKDQGNKLKTPRKGRIFLAAVLLLIGVTAAGSTLAWLVHSSGEVTNTFVVPTVTPDIEENFTDGGNTKSEVRVRNTVAEGETGIDVYIRVALVPTWETSDKTVAPIPASLSDLTINWYTDNSWIQLGDYYYYKNAVAPEDLTSILINSATVRGDAPGYLAGYHMNLQVLAEAIQATETAVKNAWGQAAWNALNPAIT